MPKGVYKRIKGKKYGGTPFKKGHPPYNIGKEPFKKGMIPWNKGKSTIHSGSFKKGNKHIKWNGGVSYEYQYKNAPRPKPLNCEVCGGNRRICYDHDHTTGKFRGWICHYCNVILGMAKDNPEVLKLLIEYLSRCSNCKENC